MENASQNAISSVIPKYAVIRVLVLNTILANTLDFQDGSFSSMIVFIMRFLGFMSLHFCYMLAYLLCFDICASLILNKYFN